VQGDEQERALGFKAAERSRITGAENATFCAIYT
jgi:hypothetical protein